ncbi:MAG: TrkH family potassium uptake protein [Candidatus Omnitrophica bacterium]|nr:TrkH family potassium uptake protein [Candidatus Omnitrophota bacterium]
MPIIIAALIFKEINPALDFLIGAEIALLCGLILTWVCATNKELNWMQGMATVALSWLAAMVLSAVPLYLSGHFGSFLDACFETMSGFTTTGLTLVQDLDHLSYSHNLWRHLGPFIGGQGIAIIALALFIKGSSGGFKMYVGEGRDEKILPNVIHTARFIWLISIVYLVIGTLVLGITGILIGLKPQNAFFHGACIFMAGFDTAGFSPQSQNILYYHSLIFEVLTIVIMVVGSFNFNLHYQLWKGNFKEVGKNIETRTFLLSTMVTFFIVAIALDKLGVYSNGLGLFRKGFFQLVSGHTTTGYMTVYAQQFIAEWGDLALIGLIIAMALGGCACSTAGGIKMLRVGIIFKALKQDIKRIILPGRAIVTQQFHHIKTVFLEDVSARAALTITMAYIILYILGAFIGVGCGYPILDSLFESTSAAGNVGLSCGITSPSMPVVLKVTYIIQMWAGRLEFMSVFVLLGFFVAFLKGK